MLILASQSRYRKKQLRDFGLRFRAIRPEVDEAALKREWLTRIKSTSYKDRPGRPKTTADFARLVRFLATQKAKSVAATAINPAKSLTYIIGSDQMAIVDGKKLDKPGSHAKAVRQLKSMRAKTHFLITAVAVIRVNSKRLLRPRYIIKSAVVTAKIKMRNFTDKEMLATLKADRPYDCAGSYKLEKSGLQLIESLHVSDPSAIIGLPLIAMHRLLKELGYKN